MPTHYHPVSRIKNLAPSVTLALDAKVKNMIAEGTDIVNLTVGEPNFDTPEYIKNAAIEALHKGYTHYTATAGIAQLREAVAQKFFQDNDIEYTSSEVIVGVGSKQLLFHAFMSLLEKGDEVLVPVPTWGSYMEQIKLAEGIPVLIPLQSPFKLTCADIEAFITSKTKVLLLNSPSNPTGAIIEKKELEKIAQLAIEKKLWIVSDEIYEKLIYEQEHISIASLSTEIKDRTITINGFSKAYAMTGWRIGYAGGPLPVIKAMEALQSQTTSNTCSITQYAAWGALKGNQRDVQKMKVGFEQQRNVANKLLSKIPQVTYSQPEGAFYFFINIQKLLNSSMTSAEWCELLLEKATVALVPGEAFYFPGYVRLSFANSVENLERGILRIQQFIEGTL